MIKKKVEISKGKKTENEIKIEKKVKRNWKTENKKNEFKKNRK